MTEPPPSEGRIAAALSAVKGLSLTNVLVLALVALILVPVYVIYRAVNDAAVMDRLLSSYEEIPNASGCVLRQVKTRGGPSSWSLSSGFAFHGSDRWQIAVILDQPPDKAQLDSHCATLRLIADQVLKAWAP